MLDPNFDPLKELQECQHHIVGLRHDVNQLAVQNHHQDRQLLEISKALRTASEQIAGLATAQKRQQTEIDTLFSLLHTQTRESQ